MTDPAVVPWNLVWVGLGLAITGAVQAFSGACNDKRARTVIGGTILTIGVLFMLAPPFINGTAFVAKAIIEAVQPPKYEAPDRSSGAFLIRSGP
jgi:hypothetical protein